MVINGKTRTQQWVENLSRERVFSTRKPAFPIMTRVKGFLDFAGSFSLLRVDLKLQALELLPLKRSPHPGETPVFNINPRIAVSIAPSLHETRFNLNFNVLKISPQFNLKTSLRFNTTALSRLQTSSPGTGTVPGSVEVSVLNTLSNRGLALNRLIRKVNKYKTISYKTISASRQPASDGPLMPEEPLETVQNHVLAASRLLENVYRYQTVSLSGPVSHRETGPLSPDQTPWSTPQTHVYTHRREAALDVEDALTGSNPNVVFYSSRIHTGDRFVHNIHRMISYVLSTGEHKPSSRTGEHKEAVVSPATPAFYPLQRLDTRYVDRPSASMGFEVRTQSPFEPWTAPPPAAAAMEMVTKKIKKVETRINTAEVEQTVIRSVSQQVDQTVRQQLEKQPAFAPAAAQQLEENIYSRLVNRIVLEKERLEY